MNKIFVEASTCEDSDILHCAESVLKSLDGILSLVPLPPVLYKYELMVRGERSNTDQDLVLASYPGHVGDGKMWPGYEAKSCAYLTR